MASFCQLNAYFGRYMHTAKQGEKDVIYSRRSCWQEGFLQMTEMGLFLSYF